MNERFGRREFLKMGAGAAAAATFGTMGLTRAFGQDGRGSGGKRPNILFVFSDEHRWCSLPFTQTSQMATPNFERMARQGTRFANCLSTSPICIPYRGMLITGQWPHQSSCISNDWFGNPDVIGVDSPTIAHAFKDAGYTTGYVGKWHLRNETCANAGFDYFKHWLYGDDHWKTKVRDIPSGEDFHEVEGYNATGMTDQAIDFMKAQADNDAPWLLMLSINPPHWRWDDAPEEFLELYPDEKLPLRPNVTESYKNEKERAYLRHYHAHISAVDRELGRLMDTLKELGTDDDTVLVYTSDHGSSFGSNGVGSKANPYEESIRVPLMVRWPGHVPERRVVDNLIGTTDLHTTLCGLAGVEPPEQAVGQDFSPVMLGRDGPDPASQFILVNNFVRNYFRVELESERNFFYPFRGVRTKRYTYAVRADGEWLLYDNREDPYQMRNLVDDPEYADTKAELREELDGWLAKAEDPYIPEAWRKLPLPERVAVENRHWTLQRFTRQTDRLKREALAPYLAQATTDAERERLRAACDRVYDEPYLGRYMALEQDLNGRRRHSRRPKDEIREALAEHEARGQRRLKSEAEEVLSGAN